MGISREQAEQILIRRVGRLMTAADMDGLTNDGSNPDLADPILFSARQCALTVASVAAITDAELSTLAVGDTDKFLDIAELRTLENILGNYDGVDITVGPRRESLGQIPDRLLKQIETKRTNVLVNYGIGIPNAVIETSKLYGANADTDLMWFGGA